MAFKFIAFFALVATSSAGLLNTHHTHQAYSDAPSVSYSSISTPDVTHQNPSYTAPTYKAATPLTYSAPAYKSPSPVAYSAPVAKAFYAEPSEPAHYNFEYVVEDPHTGDSKTHKEIREGDITKGSYSLIEADGTKRFVEYAVDAHSGFNAVVHQEPAQGFAKPAATYVAKVAAPAAFAVPVVKEAVPAYTAQAHFAYSSPVVAKLPSFAKVSYSNAPEVSYSSVSSPVSHEAASYYH